MSTEKGGSEGRQRPTPRGFKRPQDFARKSGRGINQVYQAVKDGSLPSVRVGGRFSFRTTPSSAHSPSR